LNPHAARTRASWVVVMEVVVVAVVRDSYFEICVRLMPSRSARPRWVNPARSRASRIAAPVSMKREGAHRPPQRPPQPAGLWTNPVDARAGVHSRTGGARAVTCGARGVTGGVTWVTCGVTPCRTRATAAGGAGPAAA